MFGPDVNLKVTFVFVAQATNVTLYRHIQMYGLDMTSKCLFGIEHHVTHVTLERDTHVF